MLALLYFLLLFYPRHWISQDHWGTETTSSSSDSLLNKQLPPRYFLLSGFLLYCPRVVHASRKWRAAFPASLYDTQLGRDLSSCSYSSPQEWKSALSLASENIIPCLREGFLHLHNPLRQLRNTDLNLNPSREKIKIQIFDKQFLLVISIIWESGLSGFSGGKEEKYAIHEVGNIPYPRLDTLLHEQQN